MERTNRSSGSSPNRLAPIQLQGEAVERLEALAPLFSIELSRVTVDDASLVKLSGPGFSGPEGLLLPPDAAKVRLLAEICSVLSRWVAFSLLESCEVTLFNLPPERVERYATWFRKHLTLQAQQKQREAVQELLHEILSNTASQRTSKESS